MFGVGINDLNYPIKDCVFYRTWKNMLKRCYCESYKKNKPSYQNCSVSEEWLRASVFKEWMEQQDYKGKCLDKDLLGDSKVYSKETCMFVSEQVNKFLVAQESKGELPLGVSADKGGKFRVQCKDLSGKTKYLGLFDCPDKGHIKYIEFKRELIPQLVDPDEEVNVFQALLDYFPNPAQGADSSCF